VILPTGSILHYMAGGNAHYFGIKVYSSNPKTAFIFSSAVQGRQMDCNRDDRGQLYGQIRTVRRALWERSFWHARMPRAGRDWERIPGGNAVWAISQVRELREVRVWSRNKDKREALRAGVQSSSV